MSMYVLGMIENSVPTVPLLLGMLFYICDPFFLLAECCGCFLICAWW